jgi:hypothetical protein
MAQKKSLEEWQTNTLMSHPTEKIPEMITPIIEGHCDATVGSRYMIGGNLYDGEAYRPSLPMPGLGINIASPSK